MNSEPEDATPTTHQEEDVEAHGLSGKKVPPAVEDVAAHTAGAPISPSGSSDDVDGHHFRTGEPSDDVDAHHFKAGEPTDDVAAHHFRGGSPTEDVDVHAAAHPTRGEGEAAAHSDDETSAETR
jgi:hypothetical protein